MQPIIDFFTDLFSWYSQLVAGETALSVLSFWIGIVSFVVGIAAMVYAYKSASRSDRLLRRLVVYPFRELDLAISQLPPVQREELVQLFRMSSAKRRFDLDDAREELGQFAEVSLDLLVEQGWLRREGSTPPKFRINPDRKAYLTFFTEASAEEKE